MTDPEAYDFALDFDGDEFDDYRKEEKPRAVIFSPHDTDRPAFAVQ